MAQDVGKTKIRLNVHCLIELPYCYPHYLDICTCTLCIFGKSCPPIPILTSGFIYILSYDKLSPFRTSNSNNFKLRALRNTKHKQESADLLLIVTSRL